MPSRLAVALILLFWLAVTGYVVRREVLPRYFADAPPQVAIELVDELSTANTTWGIYRENRKKGEDERVGSMTSRTEHVPADDTFRFTNSYRGLSFDLLNVTLQVPSAQTAVRVTRDGRLREQTMNGQFEAVAFGATFGTATVDVAGRVVNDRLVGRAKLSVPVLMPRPVDEELTPVPVPDGRVMNPMMPVDRLRGVVPGKRWVIRQTDPMRESLQLVARKVLEQNNVNSKLIAGGGDANPVLIAEVLTEPETLDRKAGPVACWVIRYESEDKAITAKTYVRQDNGQVLRQVAGGYGERFRFERED